MTMILAIILSWLAIGLPVVAGLSSGNLLRLTSTQTQQLSNVPRLQLLAKRLRRGCECIDGDDDVTQPVCSELSRRKAIDQVYQTAATAALILFTNPAISNADLEGVANIPRSTAPPDSSVTNIDGKSITVFKTKSGLQYIDLVEGTGPSPKYGNFVSIAYKAYIKLPDAVGKSFKLDEYDSDKGYLVKHGNGRTVPGLDEGLHTMKVGGKRRIIVPPKLGYITSGLGPIPVGPVGRWKLNHLIDRMVELKGGNTIFDVEMKSIIEDEADQGYYDDESLSPEDFNTLRQNLEASQQAAAAAREG
jgi:hypothetical protein